MSVRRVSAAAWDSPAGNQIDPSSSARVGGGGPASSWDILRGNEYHSNDNVTLEQRNTSQRTHNNTEEKKVLPPAEQKQPLASAGAPIDEILEKDLPHFFLGDMTQRLTARPYRYDPGCMQLLTCKPPTIEFDLAPGPFADPIGKVVITPVVSGCSHRADVEVILLNSNTKNSNFKGTVNYNPFWRQTSRVLQWEGAGLDIPMNAQRREPCCPPCCYNSFFRIGHVGSLSTEEDGEGIVRFWDRPGQYSTCESWLLHSPWVQPALQSVEVFVKLLRQFGLQCSAWEQCRESLVKCGDECSMEDLKQDLREKRCPSLGCCNEKRSISWIPLTAEEAHETINSRYALRMYTTMGHNKDANPKDDRVPDDEKRLNLIGNAWCVEAIKWYGPFHKRYHLDPSDMMPLNTAANQQPLAPAPPPPPADAAAAGGENANEAPPENSKSAPPEKVTKARGYGDVTSFDIMFRGSLDPMNPAIDFNDLQLVIGYLVFLVMDFETSGANVLAMKTLLGRGKMVPFNFFGPNAGHRTAAAPPPPAKMK